LVTTAIPATARSHYVHPKVPRPRAHGSDLASDPSMRLADPRSQEVIDNKRALYIFTGTSFPPGTGVRRLYPRTVTPVPARPVLPRFDPSQTFASSNSLAYCAGLEASDPLKICRASPS
jgi:hypothetical protein